MSIIQDEAKKPPTYFEKIHKKLYKVFIAYLKHFMMPFCVNYFLK